MSDFEDMRMLLSRNRHGSSRGGNTDVQQAAGGSASLSPNTHADTFEDEVGTPDRSLSLLPTQTRAGDEPPQKQQVCPKCRGTRWLRSPLPPWDANYQRKGIACDCLLEERRARRRQDMLQLCTKMGFKPEKTVATYRSQVQGVQQAIHATKDFIAFLVQRKDPGANISGLWIVYIGPVGVGKSHLAMSIGNACIDADIETLFATVPDLLDHLRAAFAPGAPVVYDELFERLRNCEVLILDDLGTERSSPWADEKLFQLLNHRYNRCLPTVVTMNQKSWPHLDDRLQSRLSDASLVVPVRMEQAKDYRRYPSQPTLSAVQAIVRGTGRDREEAL